MSEPMLLFAVSIILAWDPAPFSEDIALYRLYIGIQPLLAGNPALVSYSVPAPDTEYRVHGLDYGTRYFFAVTAVNFAGGESGYSNEVSYTPPLPGGAPQ